LHDSEAKQAGQANSGTPQHRRINRTSPLSASGLTGKTLLNRLKKELINRMTPAVYAVQALSTGKTWMKLGMDKFLYATATLIHLNNNKSVLHDDFKHPVDQ
jgi:hypothetical protein